MCEDAFASEALERGQRVGEGGLEGGERAALVDLAHLCCSSLFNVLASDLFSRVLYILLVLNCKDTATVYASSIW